MSQLTDIDSRHVGKFWTVAQLANWFAGSTLIVAALLKSLAPQEIALLATVYHIPLWASFCLLLAEIALGVALMLRIGGRSVVATAAMVFLAFAAFSLYRAMAGFESCGCFGAVKVSPWFTTALDLVIAALLGWSMYRGCDDRKASATDFLSWLLATSILGAVAMTLTIGQGPARLQPNAGIEEVNGLVILDPEDWIGQELPIRRYLQTPSEITDGEWTLLLYHHDCPDCQRAIPGYVRQAEQQVSQLGRSQILLVEVPPLGPASDYSPTEHTHLDEGVEWFVQAPLELTLIDGEVINVRLIDANAITELSR